jgi:hypothetical protein
VLESLLVAELVLESLLVEEFVLELLVEEFVLESLLVAELELLYQLKHIHSKREQEQSPIFHPVCKCKNLFWRWIYAHMLGYML